jgi:hypothetical protein
MLALAQAKPLEHCSASRQCKKMESCRISWFFATATQSCISGTKHLRN